MEPERAEGAEGPSSRERTLRVPFSSAVAMRAVQAVSRALALEPPRLDPDASVQHAVQPAGRDGSLAPWRCKVCGQRFDAELDRDLHFVQHGAAPLWCPGCGQRFVAESALRQHVRDTHPGQLLFACETCGHRAACCCDTHAHAARHSRALACPQCGLQTGSRMAYTMHLEEHMGLVPLTKLHLLARALVDVGAVVAAPLPVEVRGGHGPGAAPGNDFPATPVAPRPGVIVHPAPRRPPPDATTIKREEHGDEDAPGPHSVAPRPLPPGHALGLGGLAAVHQVDFPSKILAAFQES